jgi:hypothetical protein
MRLAELGEAGGGIAYPAVSAAIKRFEKRLPVDRDLIRKLTAAQDIVEDSDVTPLLSLTRRQTNRR